MSRLNPDCWVWSPRRPLGLLPQHPWSHREEEEEEEVEEEEEHPAACSYNTGCHDVIIQAAGSAQWLTSDPAVLSGISSSSGLAGRGPGPPSSQRPEPVMDAGGRCCWEGPGTETRGCVCVYGQREPEGLGPCWPGSPYVYYGVRRNLVVGVEVVEEVAVEDTLEVITDDIYTDDLLDPELLHDALLFPT